MVFKLKQVMDEKKEMYKGFKDGNPERAGIFESYDALGGALHDIWKQEGGKVPQVRSIGAKLSELNNGKKTWWNNHRRAAEILADLLEMDIEDLELDQRGIPPARLFEFWNFPRVRPFDPKSEQPCKLGLAVPQNVAVDFKPLLSGEPNLLGFDLYQPFSGNDANWIYMPPSSGKSFCLHWHRVWEIAITAEVGSLAEATRLIHEEGHLLIEVNAPDIETDSESLQALKERGQVTILASFPLPRQPAENQPAENQPAENQPAENQNKEDSGWRVYQWQFRNDWRKIFLQWISERIEGDAPFNVSAFSDWLFQEDSEGTLFPVPDDLLPFCAYAYEKGEDQLVGLFQGAQSKADFAAEWLRQLIEEKAKAISEHTGRLRQHGVEAVRGLIAQRIQNLSYPWLGGLREKDWVSMIPDELAPETSSYEDIQRELEGIKECTEEERNQKIRSAEMILKDDKRRVISNLKALGVLRPQASGLLDLYPRWVVNWRGQKWVENALKKKPGVWGGCRVDRDRCSIIESILDECTDEKIMELSEQAVQDFTPSRLGDAGAIEALFSEIAKRLRPSNKFETHRELLHELWRHQKRLMCCRYPDSPPLPLTCHESENIWITWFAECWAWSLYVEPPEEDLPKEIYWLFPGWCPVDLGQMPSILGSFYLGTLDDEPFRRMLQMIPDVLKCAVNQDLPETLPDLFLLALLIDENRNFSDLQPAHIEAVIRSQWVRPYIVTNLSEGKRSDLAKAVWKWVIDGEGQTFSPEDLFNLDQPFFEFILENLPRDDFMLGLKEPFSAVLLRLFKHLPQKHREPLVRWLLEKTPERIEQWINTQTMEAMGPDQVPLLELLIQSEIGASWMLIRRLWQVDPDRAFEKAQEAFETDQDAGHWFAEAVPRYLSHLLKIVEAAPRADVPEWLTRWLSQRLTRYSTVADQAYVLLNKIRNTD